ncbi:MAG TPA: DUF2840 domain-containing protein [Gammaproteobacteria bacterium]|nr:DUF2840 domain-containing protein [Gammaproteobacteria bacterium]
MVYPITTVLLDFREGRRNHRLLFGNPSTSTTGQWAHGITVRCARFLPGSVFGVELWARNAYGTSAWHVYVLRALWPGEALCIVPQVRPGAEILLHASGANQVRLALAWLDHQRTRTDDLATVPAYVYQAADLHVRAGQAVPTVRTRVRREGVWCAQRRRH